jgi:hypothetical protein
LILYRSASRALQDPHTHTSKTRMPCLRTFFPLAPCPTGLSLSTSVRAQCFPVPADNNQALERSRSSSSSDSGDRRDLSAVCETIHLPRLSFRRKLHARCHVILPGPMDSYGLCAFLARLTLRHACPQLPDGARFRSRQIDCFSNHSACATSSPSPPARSASIVSEQTSALAHCFCCCRFPREVWSSALHRAPDRPEDALGPGMRECTFRLHHRSNSATPKRDLPYRRISWRGKESEQTHKSAKLRVYEPDSLNFTAVRIDSELSTSTVSADAVVWSLYTVRLRATL